MNMDRLPIGSVVLLKESTRKVMIMGFCQKKESEAGDGKLYDYCGCLYPEGYQDSSHVYLFDHDMIEKVYSAGYMDDEQFAFQKVLTAELEKLG